MKTIIITFTFCLIGAIFANPISFNIVLESNELDSNSTESLSVSQSSENNTSEIQSSEENSSNQSSESESLEDTSEDKTSEESDSESEEETEFMTETRDDTMGSEENVRKSWVRVFPKVVQNLSADDNSSTEVKGQSEEHLRIQTPTVTTLKQKANTKLALVENSVDSSESTSDSTDTSDSTAITAATADSSESTSSESNETSETSETSDSSDSSDSTDSSDTSESTEDSNGSDSTELQQIKHQNCVNGTQSCESEEYFFQDIGDDGHHSVDNLMVPDEDERELSLRR
ncbi:secretory calcium-binding phosphoprotein 1 [Sphaeramia orbicularis]|uniref:Dentin sialophosphoprotein-like n=1 Tax=Sphaeramia orbicularis TaxID=375764 RepID=A0A672Y4Q6_9TELE|nr:dentin sialophosphoprotein-like [Sphaeramia orbicularis]